MTDPATITGLALKAAEILAPELVKTGAGRVRGRILGTPAERGLRDVYTRSITGLLVEIAQAGEPNDGQSGTPPDSEAMKVADTVLGELCRDGEAAELLLNVALKPVPVPVRSLRQRATALGHAPDTLPFVFDDAMDTLAGKIYEEFLEEAKKEDSRVQSVVNEATLAFIRSVYLARRAQNPEPTYSQTTPSEADEDELVTALRTLERLDPQEPLQPGRLPHPAIMPLRKNPNFVGREEDLKEVAAILKEGGAAAVGEVTVAASSGLGGVGKTQLACEFTYCYGRYFHGVYWLNFGEPDRISAQVASCGGPEGMNLHPGGFRDLSVPERVRAVMSEWQGDLPRLLIFDNCEDEQLLERWLPPTGGCRVLVTSRNPNWDDLLGVTELNLGVLSRQESVKLLLKYRSDLPPEDPNLHAIAEELGDLPLALDLAGHYLKRYARDVAPATYLEDLRRPDLLDHPSLTRARGISPTDHDMNVWRTFALSYWRLDAGEDTDGLARRMLARAACLAPGEPIPEELLFRPLEPPTSAPGSQPLQPATAARDALERLVEVGLLGPEKEGIYGMHRLVAAFARAEVTTREAWEAVEMACARAGLEAVQEGWPGRQESLVPHVRHLAAAALERVDDGAAEVCTAAGLGLGQLGAYDEALPYAQRAADITAELYGPNDRHALQRRSNVGQLLKSKGDRKAAGAVYREVLEAQENHLGREDVDVAATINNLGVLLWSEDLYHEMLPLYRRALDIRERDRKRAGRRIGRSNPEERRRAAFRVAESHGNMGALMMDVGRARQAGPHFDTALDVMRNEFGPYHERIAGLLVVRGSALRALDLYPEALDSVHGALDVHNNVTTGVSEEAARALSNLGSIYAEVAEDEGIYADQRAPLREMAGNWLDLALTGSERGYGENHPVTGGLCGALGRVREAQGDLGEARNLLERANSNRQSHLQGRDAGAATTINDDAKSLVGWGLHDEAQAYLERALEIRVGILGEQSFHTSNSLFNLAVLLQLRGRTVRGRELFQRALNVRARVCGETHLPLSWCVKTCAYWPYPVDRCKFAGLRSPAGIKVPGPI